MQDLYTLCSNTNHHIDVQVMTNNKEIVTLTLVTQCDQMFGKEAFFSKVAQKVGIATFY